MRKRKQRALFAAGVDQREGQRAQVIRRKRHKLCPLGADKPVRTGLGQRVSSVMVCKEQGLSQSRAAFPEKWRQSGLDGLQKSASAAHTAA